MPAMLAFLDDSKTGAFFVHTEKGKTMKAKTMKALHCRTAFLVGCAIALLAGPAAQAQGDGPITLKPGDIKWGTSPALPTGVKYTVLSGDPAKPGPFTVRIVFPPNTKHPPHSHPDARTVTVLSGTLYFGHGDNFDEAKMQELPAVSFLTEIPKGNHFVMTKSQEAVIQVTGMGPSGTDFVNPADDPRKKK